MLGVFVTILTVILVFVCLLMSLVILMQRPKQEGLGAAFGGALTDRMLGSGTTDFLQKATVFMGVAFFVLSLTIATLMAYDRNAERESQSQEVQQAAAANGGDAEATTIPAPESTDPLGVPDIPIPGAGGTPGVNLTAPDLTAPDLTAPDLTAPDLTEPESNEPAAPENDETPAPEGEIDGEGEGNADGEPAASEGNAGAEGEENPGN